MYVNSVAIFGEWGNFGSKRGNFLPLWKFPILGNFSDFYVQYSAKKLSRNFFCHFSNVYFHATQTVNG